jgi:hypothetical protein
MVFRANTNLESLQRVAPGDALHQIQIPKHSHKLQRLQDLLQRNNELLEQLYLFSSGLLLLGTKDLY